MDLHGYQKTNLQLGFGDYFSPEPEEHTKKQKHMFSITFVLLLTVITYKYRR